MKTKVFSAVFAIATLLLLVWSCSTSEPAPAPPPATTAVDVSATDIATAGFTLSFSVAVPELAATDIKLDGDATVSSIAVSGAENKVYTVVTSALTEGKVYNVSIGKANYTFNPAPLALTIPKSTDTKVNVTFSNITTTGFTLSLSAVVTGLVATDITLSNSATVSSITGADTKTVNVVCSALTAGSTYTVTIAKAGFSFTPQPLTFIVPSAPVAGVQITDFRIVSPTIATLKTGVIPVSTGANTISNAPRWLHADKATVKAYFTLPTGATAAVGTTALASGGVLDLTSGTATIKVTNGTATADYTITLAAYDATSNPYGIYTPGDLSDMRNGLAGSYKLMNDITLPALTGGDVDVVASMAITDYATAGWLPVGNLENKFLGNLDGNNKAIKELVINRSEISYVGFFGVISSSTIKNLSLVIGSDGIKGYDNVGSLTGNANATIIVFCCVSGSTIYSKNGNIGGLIGLATISVTISDSYSTVGINVSNLNSTDVGGFIGSTGGTNLIKITRCYATGNISGIYSANVGGFIGNCTGVVGSIIENCYATGSVSAKNILGGFAGVRQGGSITNCFSTGSVTGDADQGGAIGASVGNGTVTNNYWDTQTSGQATSAGGAGVVGKTTTEMQSQATVNALNGAQTPAPWSYTASKYPVLVGVGGQ